MSYDAETPMPWGKHKGTAIEELPSSYLRWLDEECEDDDLADAARDELKYRDDHRCHKE